MRAGIGEWGIGNGRAALRQPHGFRSNQHAARNLALAHDAFPHSRFPIPHSRASRQAGFSLLEVIAAILLLAIAFAALMKVGSGAIALSRNAAAHDEAALWARSLLDSAYVTEPVQVGSHSGRFDARYRWTLAVTPWQPPDSKPGQGGLQLYKLDLTVSWGRADHPQQAHFDTLRLGQPQAPGAAP